MKHNWITRFYEVAGGDGGGAAPAKQPTLSQVFGLTGGDGTKTPDLTDPDPDKAAADAAAAKTPEDIASEEAAKKAAEDAAAAGSGDAGKTGDNPNEPNEPIDPDEPDTFFKEVEQITGASVAVEYPEGVDPLSPQGVALRDNAIRQSTFDEYDQFLRETDPRAYAFFLHRQRGGDEAEFFSQQAPTLPDIDAFKASADMQTKMVKQDLMNKGVDEDIADATIAKYIKSNTLEDKALAVYKANETAQTTALANAEKLIEQERQEELKAIAGVKGLVSKSITTGELKFVIPATEHGEFQKFVESALRIDDGKFYAVNEVSMDNIKEVLEGLYFQYKKGNLSAIIQKQVQTKAVQRLRTNAAASAAPVKGAQGNDKAPTKHVTLAQVFGLNKDKQ